MNLLRPASLAFVAAAVVLPAFGQTDQMDEPARTTTTTTVERDGAYDSARYEEMDLAGPQGGETEFTLAGAGSNDKDFESGTFNISADLSTYISDVWSVGLRQDVGYSDQANGGSDWSGASQVFTQIHFGERVRPFVGAGIGYLYGDGVDDTFFGGPEAGVRVYVKPETFIFGRVAYQFLFESGDDLTDQFDDGRFVYTVGIGFTF